MTQIHVIHENAAWLAPLAAAFDRQRLPWRDWFLDRGVFDLSQPPPQGVYYNRMSASSHTRDHRYAAELTAAVLAWLERHERRVVNGSAAALSTSRSARRVNTPLSRPPASARPIPFSSPARNCLSRRRANALPEAPSSSSRTAAAKGSV